MIPTEQQIDKSILRMIRNHGIAVEQLTERQMADAIKQAIKAGDFIRHVRVDNQAQSVTYIPGIGMDELRSKYYELIHAVVVKCEGETRHETALRYILERENHGVSHFPVELTGHNP